MKPPAIPPVINPKRGSRKWTGWRLVFAVCLKPIALLAILILPIAWYANYQLTEAPLHERNGAEYRSIVHNLRIIEGAKDQWSLEHRKAAGDTPAPRDITPYLKNNVMPPVVFGETYNINPVGVAATATTATKLHGRPAGSIISIP